MHNCSREQKEIVQFNFSRPHPEDAGALPAGGAREISSSLEEHLTRRLWSNARRAKRNVSSNLADASINQGVVGSSPASPTIQGEPNGKAADWFASFNVGYV